ncbi:MAG: FAD-binding protein [Rhodospirillales bacterium]|nr:FAD-binding protein [Rhodospirillales bacterium]
MSQAARGAGAREDALSALRSLLGERLVRSQAVRAQHSHGEGLPLPGLPDAVAFPEANEEVAAIARLCGAHGVPIVPFGAGTSLEGHVAALHGGVALDMTRMDRLLAVSAEALDCRVQAGLTRRRLNTELRATGLHFPVDPGAEATIGGMAATRASGTSAVRYGTMRDNVLGLTVVTPQGEIVTTGGRARKSAAGLDLTALFVGSEGTLGIITEVQLRLHPLPETVTAAVCQFADLAGAVDAVIAGLQSGIGFARVELLNDVQMQVCIAYSHLDEFQALPTLFLEFAGSAAAVAEQVACMQEIAAALGGTEFRFAARAEDRSRLWKARHEAYYACMAFRPGCNNMGTDACVPISELAACIRETEADIAASGLIAPIIGHVGDGNFHLGILYDAADAGETARAEALARRVGERAIRLGGTCTGEHGIGAHKRGLLALEHGPGIGLMRRVKAAIDPTGIMNPGKMLPDADMG